MSFSECLKSFPSSEQQTTTDLFTNSEQYSILWHLLSTLIQVVNVLEASETQTKTLKDHKVHRNSCVKISQACQKVKNSQDKIPIRLEEMGIWENAVTDTVLQVTKVCCSASTCRIGFESVTRLCISCRISTVGARSTAWRNTEVFAALFLRYGNNGGAFCAFGTASFVMLLIPSIHHTIPPLEQPQ